MWLKRPTDIEARRLVSMEMHVLTSFSATCLLIVCLRCFHASRPWLFYFKSSTLVSLGSWPKVVQLERGKAKYTTLEISDLEPKIALLALKLGLQSSKFSYTFGVEQP